MPAGGGNSDGSHRDVHPWCQGLGAQVAGRYDGEGASQSKLFRSGGAAPPACAGGTGTAELSHHSRIRSQLGYALDGMGLPRPDLKHYIGRELQSGRSRRLGTELCFDTDRRWRSTAEVSCHQPSPCQPTRHRLITPKLARCAIPEATRNSQTMSKHVVTWIPGSTWATGLRNRARDFKRLNPLGHHQKCPLKFRLFRSLSVRAGPQWCR